LTCNYCTPNKQGKRKTLAVNEYPLRGFSLERKKREVLRIYRKRNKKKSYFIGFHSLDLSGDGLVLRNNGFKFGKEINFCPICGGDLRR